MVCHYVCHDQQGMQSSQGWMLNPNALMFVVLEEKGDKTKH